MLAVSRSNPNEPMSPEFVGADAFAGPCYQGYSGIWFLRLLETATHELLHLGFWQAGDDDGGAGGAQCRGPDMLEAAAALRAGGRIPDVTEHWTITMAGGVLAEQIVFGEPFGWTTHQACCGECGAPSSEYRGQCETTCEPNWLERNLRLGFGLC